MNSPAVQVAVAVAQAIALLMSVAFITYVLIIVVPFSRYRPRPPGNPDTLTWHLFVPALNEEQVIGGTIDYLRAVFPAAHVWVIDDDSDDRTGPIAAARARFDPLVHVVSRRFPEARTGKGNALNAAYREVDKWMPAFTDRRKTIIGVIDADGRPALNCLEVCAGTTLFGDPGVGSVQIMVQMINRDDPARSRSGDGWSTPSGTPSSGCRIWSSGSRSRRSRPRAGSPGASGWAGTGSSAGCPRWTWWPTRTATRGAVPCWRTMSSACTC